MLARLRFLMARALTPGLDRELARQRRAVRASPERIEAMQLGKLNALLGHWRRVDFYARLLAEHGAPTGPLESLEELARLPVVTKRFITAHLDRIARMPRAGRLDGTSGSTGVCFSFYRCRSAAAPLVAATVLAAEMVGLDFWSDRRFVVWHVSDYRRKRRLARIGKRVRRVLSRTRLVNVCGMDADRAAEVLTRIARYRPKALFGFPANLEMLARVGRDRRIAPPRPAMIITSGEALTAEARRSIHAYFDAPVYDRYGSAEVHLVAQQCPRGDALHVPPSRLIVERDGSGELLLTDLDNRTTPFIRYAVGDSGRVARSQCPCGRGGQVIESLLGRTCDLTWGPSGRLLHEQFWSSVVRLAPGVEEFQVVQTHANRFDLRIVTNGAYRDSSEFFRRILRDYAGADVTLTVTRVERIEPGPSGKRRFVIRMDADGPRSTGSVPPGPDKDGDAPHAG